MIKRIHLTHSHPLTDQSGHLEDYDMIKFIQHVGVLPRGLDALGEDGKWTPVEFTQICEALVTSYAEQRGSRKEGVAHFKEIIKSLEKSMLSRGEARRKFWQHWARVLDSWFGMAIPFLYATGLAIVFSYKDHMPEPPEAPPIIGLGT